MSSVNFEPWHPKAEILRSASLPRYVVLLSLSAANNMMIHLPCMLSPTHNSHAILGLWRRSQQPAVGMGSPYGTGRSGIQISQQIERDLAREIGLDMLEAAVAS